MVQRSSPTNDPGSSPRGAGSCTTSPAACKVPPLGKHIPSSLERLGADLLGVTTWKLLLTQNQDFFPLSVLPEEVWELYLFLSPDSLSWKCPEEQPGQGLGIHFSSGVNCAGGWEGRVLCLAWGVSAVSSSKIHRLNSLFASSSSSHTVQIPPAPPEEEEEAGGVRPCRRDRGGQWGCRDLRRGWQPAFALAWKREQLCIHLHGEEAP